MLTLEVHHPQGKLRVLSDKHESGTRERQIRISTPSVIYTINDLIVSRASDESQVPLVAFPGSATSLTQYVHLTGATLDKMAGCAASKLIEYGLPPTVSAGDLFVHYQIVL